MPVGLFLLIVYIQVSFLFIELQRSVIFFPSQGADNHKLITSYWKWLDKMDRVLEWSVHWIPGCKQSAPLNRHQGRSNTEVNPVKWSQCFGRRFTVRSSSICCPVIAQQTRITCYPNTPTRTHIENTWLASWITVLYFHARTNADF